MIERKEKEKKRRKEKRKENYLSMEAIAWPSESHSTYIFSSYIFTC